MVLALEALTSGEPRERGLELARRALAGAPPIPDEPTGSTIVLFPIAGMIEAGAPTECATCSTGWSTTRGARDRSSATGRPAPSAPTPAGWPATSTARRPTRCRAGRCCARRPARVNAAQALGVLIDVLVARGDLEGAEAELTESGLADAPADPDEPADARRRATAPAPGPAPLGRRAGRVRSARRGLRGARRRESRARWSAGPIARWCCSGWVASTRRWSAAAAEVERARRYGAAYAMSAALRALGLALGGAEGADRLAEAAEAAEAAGSPLHLAYALLDQAPRCAGSGTSATLASRCAGRSMASRCGAHATAETARSRAAGDRGATPPRRRQRRRLAHGARAPRGPPRGRRPQQPGDRPGAVHHPQDRREARRRGAAQARADLTNGDRRRAPYRLAPQSSIRSRR